MTWIDIARRSDLPIERGVAALVGDDAVAVFRLADEELLCVDHVDPFTATPTLARGLVGSAGDIVFVASPLQKRRFDLRSGVCLDDPTVRVRTWPIEVVDEVVRVAARPR